MRLGRAVLSPPCLNLAGTTTSGWSWTTRPSSPGSPTPGAGCSRSWSRSRELWGRRARQWGATDGPQAGQGPQRCPHSRTVAPLHAGAWWWWRTRPQSSTRRPTGPATTSRMSPFLPTHPPADPPGRRLQSRTCVLCAKACLCSSPAYAGETGEVPPPPTCVLPSR